MLVEFSAERAFALQSETDIRDNVDLNNVSSSATHGSFVHLFI